MEKEQILELIDPVFKALDHLADATEGLIKIVKLNAATIEAFGRTIEKLKARIQELEA